MGHNQCTSCLVCPDYHCHCQVFVASQHPINICHFPGNYRSYQSVYKKTMPTLVSVKTQLYLSCKVRLEINKIKYHTSCVKDFNQQNKDYLYHLINKSHQKNRKGENVVNKKNSHKSHSSCCYTNPVLNLLFYNLWLAIV